MGTIVEQTLPVEIVRGVANTLSIALEDEDTGSSVTPLGIPAPTLQVKLGAEVLEEPTPTPGDPTTATLLAASTTDKTLGARVLLVWDLDGETYIQSGTLVRWKFHPTITDADLIADFPNLLTLGGLSNATTFRKRASEIIRRKLWKNAKRPELVLDAWALTDAHVFLTQALIGEFYYSALGDERWKDYADRKMDKFMAEWQGLSFKYDEDEDGHIGEGEVETTPGQSSLWLN